MRRRETLCTTGAKRLVANERSALQHWIKSTNRPEDRSLEPRKHSRSSNSSCTTHQKGEAGKASNGSDERGGPVLFFVLLLLAPLCVSLWDHSNTDEDLIGLLILADQTIKREMESPALNVLQEIFGQE